MPWVKLKKYCDDTGETPHSVHAKRKARIFKDGVHTRVAGDGNLWVNTDAVQEWVENSSPENRSGELVRG